MSGCSLQCTNDNGGQLGPAPIHGKCATRGCEQVLPWVLPMAAHTVVFTAAAMRLTSDAPQTPFVRSVFKTMNTGASPNKRAAAGRGVDVTGAARAEQQPKQTCRPFIGMRDSSAASKTNGTPRCLHTLQGDVCEGAASRGCCRPFKLDPERGSTANRRLPSRPLPPGASSDPHTTPGGHFPPRIVPTCNGSRLTVGRRSLRVVPHRALLPVSRYAVYGFAQPLARARQPPRHAAGDAAGVGGSAPRAPCRDAAAAAGWGGAPCHRLSQGLSQAVTGCHKGCHRLSQGLSQAVTGDFKLQSGRFM